MNISEIIRGKKKFLDKSIDVEGFFILSGGKGYMISNKDEWGMLDTAIELKHPNIKELMYSTVPAYGGGPLPYCDSAKVSGVLRMGLNSSGIELVNLKALLIIRPEGEYEIKLNDTC